MVVSEVVHQSTPNPIFFATGVWKYSAHLLRAALALAGHEDGPSTLDGGLEAACFHACRHGGCSRKGGASGRTERSAVIVGRPQRDVEDTVNPSPVVALTLTLDHPAAPVVAGACYQHPTPLAIASKNERLNSIFHGYWEADASVTISAQGYRMTHGVRIARKN